MSMTEYPLYIRTNLGTHFAIGIYNFTIVSDLKKKILVEHMKLFPNIGDVKINSLKVKLQNVFFDIADSMNVKSAFHNVKENDWFIELDICMVNPLVPSVAILEEEHIGTRTKTKKKKTSHPSAQEIAPIQSAFQDSQDVVVRDDAFERKDSKIVENVPHAFQIVCGVSNKIQFNKRK